METAGSRRTAHGRSRSVLVASAAVLTVASCTGSAAKPGASASSTDPLNPHSQPSSVLRRQSNCGAFVIYATVHGRIVALASCAGYVGLHTVPEVTLRVGDTTTITGLPTTATLDSSPRRTLVIHSQHAHHLRLLTATRPGDTTVYVTGADCAFLGPPQPRRCTLVRVITVSR